MDILRQQDAERAAAFLKQSLDKMSQREWNDALADSQKVVGPISPKERAEVQAFMQSMSPADWTAALTEQKEPLPPSQSEQINTDAAMMQLIITTKKFTQLPANEKGKIKAGAKQLNAQPQAFFLCLKEWLTNMSTPETAATIGQMTPAQATKWELEMVDGVAEKHNIDPQKLRAWLTGANPTKAGTPNLKSPSHTSKPLQHAQMLDDLLAAESLVAEMARQAGIPTKKFDLFQREVMALATAQNQSSTLHQMEVAAAKTVGISEAQLAKYQGFFHQAQAGLNKRSGRMAR
jgi:hypothetical protein